MGNIIAGVAGGLASRGKSGIVGGAVAGAMNNVSNRVSGTRTRTSRIRLVNEPDNSGTSLLSNRTFRGQGNRAGGNNTGSSRLVEPESEIQLVNDPSTGGQSTNVMSNIRNIANRTMTSTNETISNLSNQMSETGTKFKENLSDTGTKLKNTGTKMLNDVKRKIKGGPLTAPKSDETGWEPPPPRIPKEKVKPFIKSLNETKAAIKRTNDRAKYIMANRELKNAAASKLQGSIKMTKDRTNYSFDVMAHHSLKDNAAAKLQAAARGAVQRKQDKAVTNMGNLTDLLNETTQYGNSQAVLNDYAAKRQNISNFGKLVSNKVKTANMIATKGDVVEGRAAEILQAMAKSKISEKGLSNKKMENAGDVLNVVKREKAANRIKARTKTKLTYNLKDASAAHETKYTGQPLVVSKGTEGSKNPAFILKARRDRGVKAAESRKIREDLQEKYKDVMQKPYKINAEKVYKGKNRFKPL